MGDDALRPVPKNSGCLRWTCGCIVILVLAPLVAAAAGWYALSGWTPAGSAWERLPADTLYAVELNDVGELVQAAAQDAGAMSLARAALRRYQGLLEAAGVPVRRELPETLYEWRTGLGWLYTTFFPNYILFGARGAGAGRADRAGQEAFLIVQPPRWFKWTAGAAATEGEVEEISDDEGRRAFIAFMGEFVVAGLNEDAVRHVVDNWSGQAAPLGGASGRADAYCMFAGRTGEPGVPADSAQTSAANAAPNTETPFMFQDPFAAPVDAPAESEARPSATHFQAIAFANETRDGWHIRFTATPAPGAAAPAAASFGGQLGNAFTVLTPENLDVFLPDSSDLELALRVPEPALRRVDAFLEKSSLPERAENWLRRGWLDRAGGAFTLLASRPVAGESDGTRLPYPPLPVLRLGWSLSSFLAPAPFANSFVQFLDSLPEPVRPFVRCEIAEDKLSGSISLPPVFANGAQPAWKFFTEVSPAMGWLSTDPGALPPESIIPRLAAERLPAPAAGSMDTVTAAINWDMSRDFIDAAAAVAADRLQQSPAGWFDGFPAGRRDVDFFVRFARQLLTAYPRGAVQAEVFMDTGVAAGKGFVPFGMNVDFE